MGAGIVNNSQNDLLQTVNQTYQYGPVFVKSNAGNKTAVKIENQTNRLNNAGWVFHDSIAYFFPAKTNITVKADKQSGSWRDINGSVDAPKEVITKNVFSTWIDFGKQTSNAKFIYAVVPGISKREAEEYKLAVRVISNNEQQQAIWHAKEKCLMVSFYKAGSVKDANQNIILTADMPVLVLLQESAASFELSVSNPLNKGGKLSLYINRKLIGEGCVWSAKTKTTTVTIALPEGHYAGSTITKQFKYSR
jgi:chondroitin AC lyase